MATRPHRAPAEGGRRSERADAARRNGADDGVAHGQPGGDESVARPRRAGERERKPARDDRVDVGSRSGTRRRGHASARARSRLNARSNPASRGSTAYLGKANDPQKIEQGPRRGGRRSVAEEIARLSSKDNRQFAPPPEARPRRTAGDPRRRPQRGRQRRRSGAACVPDAADRGQQGGGGGIRRGTTI